MQYKANSPEDYINQAPEERQAVLKKLRKTITDHLPEGFQEVISYGMIGYVVPHALYPDGYHCDPKTPLPFMSFASQKNSINLYHMGVYAKPEIHDWFVSEYPKHCKRKLDMGKSCIRFKKIEEIPFDLIGELCTKLTVKDWVGIYEKNIKKK
ncbi:iron chaperone [Lacinutrix sp. MEBiC02404]